MAIDNKVTFGQKLAGLALAATAALSTLPGCSATSAKHAPATPTPSPTPQSYVCPQLTVGQSVTFDGFQTKLNDAKTVNSGNQTIGFAQFDFDGILIWLDEGDCVNKTIKQNTYTLCLYNADGATSSAYFCINRN